MPHIGAGERNGSYGRPRSKRAGKAMSITSEACRLIACAIRPAIRDYIERHRERFEVWLASQQQLETDHEQRERSSKNGVD
jgi:hypothetical protein